MIVNEDNSVSVKALDEERNKVVTFQTVPCPKCRKWVLVNHYHKYCQWCGVRLEWSESEGEE